MNPMRCCESMYFFVANNNKQMSRVRYTPPPLPNRGNTCYAASVLQMIGSCRPLIDAFTKVAPTFTLSVMFRAAPPRPEVAEASPLLPVNSPTITSTSHAKPLVASPINVRIRPAFIHDDADADVDDDATGIGTAIGPSHEKPPISPVQDSRELQEARRRLMREHHSRVFRGFGKMVRGSNGTQQDAHEYALQLMNWLREDMKDESVKEANKIKRIACAAFDMKMKVTKTCPNCNKTSESAEEQHICLSLPVMSTLLEAWQSYTTSCIEMRCEACNASGDFVFRKTITTHPRYLWLHMARFMWYPSPQKLNTPMRFQHHLELDGVKYSLKGFIVHNGDMRGGHFLCCVRISGRWFLANDMFIRPLSVVEMSSKLPGAYMLLYSRCGSGEKRDVSKGLPLSRSASTDSGSGSSSSWSLVTASEA